VARERSDLSSGGILYRLYQARLRRSLAEASLPHHVAMIIDGNRRWARQRALETAAHGHRAGAAKMREFLEWCDDLGIRVVTLYLLSADNLVGRPDDELEQLFVIIGDLAAELAEEGEWRVQHVGTTEGLPVDLVDQLRDAQAVTPGCPSISRSATAAGGRSRMPCGRSCAPTGRAAARSTISPRS
jgi:short-chain Z-isoprenyl diphosphate synthase